MTQLKRRVFIHILAQFVGHSVFAQSNCSDVLENTVVQRAVHWPDGRGCSSWDRMLLRVGDRMLLRVGSKRRGGEGIVGSQISEQPV